MLARNFSKVNRDEALLGGMMQNIGKRYTLTRATDHSETSPGEGQLAEAITDGHASFGKTIMENGDFSSST